jgi:hypothetical protein
VSGDGLAGGLKVMWLSDTSAAGAAVELARRGIDPGPALERGQLAATACDGRLLSGQAFRAQEAVGWLAGQLEASRREGFPGLRVAVDMSWALRPVAGVEELPAFEEGIAARPPTPVVAARQARHPAARSRLPLPRAPQNLWRPE